MTDEKAFEVQLASTGEVYAIPADMSIIDVLHENGVDHPISCEQGICGTCIVKVLEGDPDHRDCILTDDEKNNDQQFTPCCSRALSDRLVLDI